MFVLNLVVLIFDKVPQLELEVLSRCALKARFVATLGKTSLITLVHDVNEGSVWLKPTTLQPAAANYRYKVNFMCRPGEESLVFQGILPPKPFVHV